MNTFQAKLTSKGQLTLPVQIREALRVGPGDLVELLIRRSGEILLCARNKPATAIVGKGSAYVRPVTREQNERLLGEAVAARGRPAPTQRAPHKRRKGG
jgi:AbrB family looped-hinge helix DNA binding protein